MAAPLGNQNAAKAKLWAAAIERVLSTYPGRPLDEDCSDIVKGLNKVAYEFVNNVMSKGDLGYFKEFGDRIDGKPSQLLGGDPQNPLPSSLIVSLVKPD